MAKKFIRGITDIKEINEQDFDTNNVNDLLSDGEHNYIHRKKGSTEEYHNLTNNLKTISSDDTDLLSVTNYNNSTNSATLHPKHDTQKEQSIESTRGTITIEHGENGTSETTKVDTNPEIVLEHANLLTDYGISKNTDNGITKLSIAYTKVEDGFNLDTLTNGRVVSSKFSNSPQNNIWFFVNSFSEGSVTLQEAVKLFENNIRYIRTRSGDKWSDWREQVGDKSVIDGLLNQKQDNLITSASIGITSNKQLRQLFYYKKEYTHDNGLLASHLKSLAQNNNVDVTKNEFNFIVKINKNIGTIDFILNDTDKNSFNTIINKYGENNSVCINGCVFTLSDSTLTVSTANNTEQNYVITFSDII